MLGVHLDCMHCLPRLTLIHAGARRSLPSGSNRPSCCVCARLNRRATAAMVVARAVGGLHTVHCTGLSHSLIASRVAGCPQVVKCAQLCGSRVRRRSRGCGHVEELGRKLAMSGLWVGTLRPCSQVPWPAQPLLTHMHNYSCHATTILDQDYLSIGKG